MNVLSTLDVRRLSQQKAPCAFFQNEAGTDTPKK